MAEENDIEIEAKGGSSKLMLIIVIVLGLAVAGLAAMLLMGGDSSEKSADTAEAAAPVKQAPIYYSLEKPLVVNFSIQSKKEVNYLQVKLKVMARDQAVIDGLTLNLPEVQHELLLLLYAQDYKTLNTEGSQKLQADVLANINEILKSRDIKNSLEAVYFTSFLMQ